MKRTLLGLVMLSSLALMAAPKANATALGECGKSYAFEVHGTEPSSSNDSVLHYIVGIGQISFNAAGTSGPNGCTVAHVETMYNDNDFGTLVAGPATCYAASSVLGGGAPCFDGGTHQTGTGTLTPSSFGGGAATLAFVAHFGWAGGGPASVDLPLAFTLQNNAGATTVLGSSVPDSGPTASAPPPGKPVLTIILQKQSSTVVLPVNGATPSSCGAFGCTGVAFGGDNSGYGTTPYVGLSVSLFQGYGAQASDPFAQPITGTFGSPVNSLQIFTNGQAGGVATFSNNDNVGNTTGATNNSCDTQVFQTGNFADGTSNNAAAIVHPVSASCADAFVSAQFILGNVVYGTDTSSFSMVTGVAASATGGLLVPPGLMADAVLLASSPPGKLTTTATVNALIQTGLTHAWNITNTSPAGCDVTITMPTATEVGGAGCVVSLMGGSPKNVLQEGDTASVGSFVATCTCAALPEDDVGVTTTLTVTSSDCPIATGAGPINVQCVN